MTLDAAEQKLVDDVARHGWHVMTVSPAVGQPEAPPFAYTIGLDATFGWPELLCYGLETDTMAVLLNNAVDELRETGAVPSDGLVLRDVAESLECKLVAVAKRHHHSHLGFAIWFARYRRIDPDKLECLQLLWPDRNRRFPGDDGCSENFKECQPVLTT